MTKKINSRPRRPASVKGAKKASGVKVQRATKHGKAVVVHSSDNNAQVLAATVGGVVLGNLIAPGIGGVIIGGIVGAVLGNSSKDKVTK